MHVFSGRQGIDFQLGNVRVCVLCWLFTGHECCLFARLNRLQCLCHADQYAQAMAKLIACDNGRRKEQNTLIHIDEAEVERVKTFKSLRTYISQDLTWSHNCCQLLKKAQQRLRKSTFATFTDVQSRVSSPAPSQRGTEAALLRTGGLSSV